MLSLAVDCWAVTCGKARRSRGTIIASALLCVKLTGIGPRDITFSLALRPVFCHIPTGSSVSHSRAAYFIVTVSDDQLSLYNLLTYLKVWTLAIAPLT